MPILTRAWDVGASEELIVGLQASCSFISWPNNSG